MPACRFGSRRQAASTAAASCGPRSPFHPYRRVWCARGTHRRPASDRTVTHVLSDTRCPPVPAPRLRCGPTVLMPQLFSDGAATNFQRRIVDSEARMRSGKSRGPGGCREMAGKPGWVGDLFASWIVERLQSCHLREFPKSLTESVRNAATGGSLFPLRRRSCAD